MTDSESNRDHETSRPRRGESGAGGNVRVWSPVYTKEPLAQVCDAADDVAGCGYECLLVVNGPGSVEYAKHLHQQAGRLGASVHIDSVAGARGSIGRAQQVALLWFLGSRAHVLVRFDADRQFLASDIARLAGAALRGADLAVGLRARPGGDDPLRRLGNKVLRAVASFRGPAVDCNSGLYAMTRRAGAIVCAYPADRYPEGRLWAIAHHHGLSVAPVVVTTRERVEGETTIVGRASQVAVALSTLLRLGSQP